MRHNKHSAYDEVTNVVVVWFRLIMVQAGHLLAFMLVPLVLFVALNWFTFSFTENLFFEAPWMQPLLLMLTLFISGMANRFMMNHSPIGGLESMFLFTTSVAAHVFVALILLQDVRLDPGAYSLLLPHPLNAELLPYLYGAPVAGLIGLLFYRTTETA